VSDRTRTGDHLDHNSIHLGRLSEYPLVQAVLVLLGSLGFAWFSTRGTTRERGLDPLALAITGCVIGVYQRGLRTRRAPGAGHLFVRRDTADRESWYAKWYSDGRQVKRKIGPKRGPDGRGLDRAEAERRLHQLTVDVAPPPASRVDVEEAGTYLIEHLRGLGRKPATIEAYKSLLHVHLAPFFAGRSLDAIGVDDLEAFVRAKVRAGKSAKTIRNALGFLHTIYDSLLMRPSIQHVLQLSLILGAHDL
jgi:hypothetical protein